MSIIYVSLLAKVRLLTLHVEYWEYCLLTRNTTPSYEHHRSTGPSLAGEQEKGQDVRTVRKWPGDRRQTRLVVHYVRKGKARRVAEVRRQVRMGAQDARCNLETDLRWRNVAYIGTIKRE